MSIGQQFEFPNEQAHAREQTKRVSWLSIVLLDTASMVLFFTLGQSEAMKTAWVSDLLTAIPPIALLVAMRFELREPTTRFPFGYTRSVAIAFLVTSGVLSLFGLYLLYDALSKLVTQQRPPIGTMELFGRHFWSGWAMIAGLSFSLLCGLTLGLLKKPVARRLNDKALFAEATMNRDEWMSEGAAILGILLVGFGHWWGDSAAAAFISLEIVHDGWMNMRLVVADLMDESPSTLGSKSLDPIGEKLVTEVRRLEWVSDAAVRLREQGRALTGELFVAPRGGAVTVDQIQAAARAAEECDWRVRDLAVMPVARLESRDPPRAAS
jgi:divalent metal cation (Fe/Co/Zn/Cd) transporter